MDRKKIGSDSSSLEPALSPRVTSPPVLRLNSSPHTLLPLTPLLPLHNTSCPSKTLASPNPLLLAFFTSPHPASSHTTPILKATGPPAGKGANVRAALQGLPGLPTHPAGGTRPLPRVRCPPRPLREPQPAGRGPRRGSRQSGVPGGRGPRPSDVLSPRGGTPESPSLSALPAGTETSPPPPAAVLPTLGNRTLPPSSGFPKTPDLQILRMAF